MNSILNNEQMFLSLLEYYGIVLITTIYNGDDDTMITKLFNSIAECKMKKYRAVMKLFIGEYKEADDSFEVYMESHVENPIVKIHSGMVTIADGRRNVSTFRMDDAIVVYNETKICEQFDRNIVVFKYRSIYYKLFALTYKGEVDES